MTAKDVTDYASAVAYLDGARGANRGQYRRLAPNRYVARLDDATVGVILHHTVIVAYGADGSVTLDTGGWDTVTTKKWVNHHGPARVWSESCQLFVHVSAPGHTPARVWSCRTCKGKGKVPTECYGPGWCHGAWAGRTCEHGERSNHKRDTCEHGETARHGTGARDCYRCNGAGRCDYGSKPIHYRWSGGPLAVSADGEPIGPGSSYSAPGKPYAHTTHTTHHYVAAYVAPAPSVSGDTVLGSLRQLLPALDRSVRYPCECGKNAPTAPASDLIVHLNDAHRWTREAIADWLDTLDLDLGFPVTP